MTMVCISAGDSVKKEYLSRIRRVPGEGEKCVQNFPSENLKGIGLYNL
jgi:hypothetical protein